MGYLFYSGIHTDNYWNIVRIYIASIINDLLIHKIVLALSKRVPASLHFAHSEHGGAMLAKIGLYYSASKRVQHITVYRSFGVF